MAKTPARGTRRTQTATAASGGTDSIASLRAASDLLSRANLSARAGITFHGERNIFQAMGYKRTLWPLDYWARYKRNEIAATVVEAMPKATWRGTGELVEDEGGAELTLFEKAWEEVSQRLSVWSMLLKTDILSRLGRYACLLIGAPGEMSEALPSGLQPMDIGYLAPFSELDVSIQKFVQDPYDRRFGLPLTYQFKRVTAPPSVDTMTSSRERTGEFMQSKLVHWTRVVHVAGDTLDERVYGLPALDRIWNRLDDLEKLVGAGCEAFWLRAHQGFMFTIDKDLVLTPEERKQFSDEADEFVHGFRRMIRARGVEMDKTGSDVANFANQLDSVVTLIAGGSRIPKRILVGSERGELSSAQDKSNWDEHIGDRRRHFAEPHCVRPLVDRLIACGALPKPKQYSVRWPEIERLDEKDRSTMAVNWANAQKTFKESTGKDLILPDEIRDRVLGLPPLSQVHEGMTKAGAARAAVKKKSTPGPRSTRSRTLLSLVSNA